MGENSSMSEWTEVSRVLGFTELQMGGQCGYEWQKMMSWSCPVTTQPSQGLLRRRISRKGEKNISSSISKEVFLSLVKKIHNPLCSFQQRLEVEAREEWRWEAG